MAIEILDLAVLKRAQLSQRPYPYFIARDFVRAPAIQEVQESFPEIRKTGFHPADDMALSGAFGRLIEELKGEEVSGALSEVFGIDFNALPRFITIRKVSAAHEGRIHCDSESKVMSLLLYLNDAWSSPEGRLRVLNGPDDFDDYTAEIDPKTGTVFAFLRKDDSWHGHKPFVGERKVVQVAWLRNADEAARKTSRHRMSNVLKGIFARQH